jgi:hypothetical protein
MNIKKFVENLSIIILALLSFFIISCSTSKQQPDKMIIPLKDQYIIAEIKNLDSSSSVSINNEIKINIEDNVTDSIALTEKYPNPFSPPTTYGFKIEESDSFKISFWDRDGNIISNLFNGYLTTGKYQIKFKEMHINSDIYFIVIDNGDKKWTKKIIYIK